MTYMFVPGTCCSDHRLRMWFRATHRKAAAPMLTKAAQTIRARLSLNRPRRTAGTACTLLPEAFMDQLSFTILARRAKGRVSSPSQFTLAGLVLLYTLQFHP